MTWTIAQLAQHMWDKVSRSCIQHIISPILFQLFVAIQKHRLEPKNSQSLQRHKFNWNELCSSYFHRGVYWKSPTDNFFLKGKESWCIKKLKYSNESLFSLVMKKLGV
jgi:hypothetical protein